MPSYHEQITGEGSALCLTFAQLGGFASLREMTCSGMTLHAKTQSSQRKTAKYETYSCD